MGWISYSDDINDRHSESVHEHGEPLPPLRDPFLHGRVSTSSPRPRLGVQLTARVKRAMTGMTPRKTERQRHLQLLRTENERLHARVVRLESDKATLLRKVAQLHATNKALAVALDRQRQRQQSRRRNQPRPQAGG